MAQRKARPSTEGDGELRVGHDTTSVHYRIDGDPATLRPGVYRMRGAVACADPEAAAEAFRRGEGELRLADGSVFRLAVIAHTAGSETAYFEMRI
jgi:hypothetical protein